MGDVEVSPNYCSQNGGNLYRAPYYNRNPYIGPRIDSNVGQSPCRSLVQQGLGLAELIINQLETLMTLAASNLPKWVVLKIMDPFWL